MSTNVFKRLNTSDVFVVPYTANKNWNIISESFDEYSIKINIGINYGTESIFKLDEDYLTNNQYDRLVYESVNFNYYPTFLPKEINVPSRQNTILNDGTLSTASYDGYINLGNLDTIKYFPTDSGSIVLVMNIPKSLTSDKILPTTFEFTFSSGSYTGSIYDDGNYNLLYSGSNVSSSINTVLSQSSYVGNVFYEQNVAIVTIIPDSLILKSWRPIDPYCVV
jgi:hypothetical protein